MSLELDLSYFDERARRIEKIKEKYRQAIQLIVDEAKRLGFVNRLYYGMYYETLSVDIVIATAGEEEDFKRHLKVARLNKVLHEHDITYPDVRVEITEYSEAEAKEVEEWRFSSKVYVQIGGQEG